MNEQQLYVMNQYYIDLLKKIKSAAKDKKDTSKEARDILRSIKKYYASMDKLSNDYHKFMQEQQIWELYKNLEDKLVFSDDFMKKQLYEDIYIHQIVSVFKNNHLLSHYLCLMDIFMVEDIKVEDVANIVKKLGTPAEFDEAVKILENEELVKKLTFLKELHKKQTQSKLESELKEIENTTLGSLAKEIMKDINVEELQNSISGNDGNIFASLQDPSNGIGKVINTVSQTMMSKLASGELQQDKLLQDALSLATKLPGMMPGGMGSQLGDLGSMLQQFQNMGGADFMKGFSGAQKNAAGGRMHTASRTHKAKERLKKKLEKREENNV